MYSFAANFQAMSSDETLVGSLSPDEKSIEDFTYPAIISSSPTKKQQSRHWYSVAKSTPTESRLTEAEKHQARLSLEQAGFSASRLAQNRNKAVLWAAETGNTFALAYCLELPIQREGTRKLSISVNKKTAQTESANSDSVCPLHSAASHGHNSAVKLLLAYGVAVDTFKAYGTALHLAAEHGHDNVVRTLLNAGADINALTPVKKQTALQVAADSDHDSTVRILLARGADPNLGRRRRSLHAAAESANVVMLNLLLEAGAHINSRDDNGRTPLHLAARSGHSDATFMLVTRGAAINVGDMRGMTALEHAIHGQRQEVARFLLQSNAQKTGKTKTRDIRSSRPVTVQPMAVAVR